MGFIFIPLTTVTLADLSGREGPQGSALTNMIRQLGGTFGTATYISVRSVRHQTQFSDDLNDSRYPSSGCGSTPACFSPGATTWPRPPTYTLLRGVVTRQALILTYADAFLVIGVFFPAGRLRLFIGKKPEAPQHLDIAIK